jgi:phospholipid/cholesterol/gamma-HCH transport system substrate-binding protein
MSRMRRIGIRTAALGLAVGLSGLVSGCASITLQGVPLPGGANLGENPYHVTIQLRDALDLVPQASVKVNNVSVGQVQTIDLDPKNWYADVRVVVNGGVKLPANAIAQLKQTTLLGEKYVEIESPTQEPPQGTLTDGAVIPVERTNRFPEFEEVFGALSMLLNGGGVGQVQSIAKELNTALNGREGDTRALLDDLNTLVSTLDGQRGNITMALDGLDRLSANLVEQRGNLDVVLTDLQPGLAVLNQQRPDLVRLLRALDKLSDVAVDVIHHSREDLVADLEALRPTLRELARSGDALPRSLEVFATPPFTDAAIKPTAGDRMNLNAAVDLNLQDLLDNLLNATTPPATPPNPLTSLAPTAGLPPLSVPGLLPGQPSATDSGGTPLGGLTQPGLGGDK